MTAHNLTSVIRSLCLLNTCCIGLMFTAACASADEVVVRLKDGRTVSGTIDARTDDEQLWLRAAEPSILLRSSFAWDDVLSANHAGKTFSAAEFRTLAKTLKTNVDLERFHQPRPEVVAPANGALPQNPRGPVFVRPQDFRVASLEIYARVANWDNDPEDDGLLVTIYPMTANGRLRPIDGQLNLKLFGRLNQPSLRRRHFPELTRGSLRVRAADFGPDGATYKFRFRNFHPEKNLDIDVFGLLSGRLVAAGHGTFDASDANVRLRRLSRFRDRLQFQSDRRFLPAENPRRLP